MRTVNQNERDALTRRAAGLAREVLALQQKIAEIEDKPKSRVVWPPDFGQDTYEIGTVIRFTKTFRRPGGLSPSRPYVYVGIKYSAQEWSVTGSPGRDLSWYELTEFMQQRAQSVVFEVLTRVTYAVEISLGTVKSAHYWKEIVRYAK